MATEDAYINPTETLQRIRRDEGDGLPGPDYRANVAGRWMADMLGPKVKEVIEELMDRPTGYDFGDTGDVLAFREAVIAGLQINLEQTARDLDPYN